MFAFFELRKEAEPRFPSRENRCRQKKDAQHEHG